YSVARTSGALSLPREACSFFWRCQAGNTIGEVAKRSNAADCKSVALAASGVRILPSPPTFARCASYGWQASERSGEGCVGVGDRGRGFLAGLPGGGSRQGPGAG